MASNPLLDVFRIKDLRDRILFTIFMLVIFRLGTALPIPGINVNALKLYFMTQESSSSSIGLTDYIDFFAGGAFKNFSVFMLGIMPYISTSIIMQLLVLVFPKLKKISEEDGGPDGYLYGIDTSENSSSLVKWRIPLDGNAWSGVAVEGSSAYVATMSGTVYAINASDEERFALDPLSRIQWTFSTGSAIAGPLHVDGGSIFFWRP